MHKSTVCCLLFNELNAFVEMKCVDFSMWRLSSALTFLFIQKNLHIGSVKGC